MISRDELIEYAQYVQNYYGTPKAYVQEQMEKGKDVILEIEIQGALEVKEKYPEAVLIFVTPPSAEELKRRLTERGTESEEVIESRLNRAYEEASYMKQYDYLLINDDLQECVENMHQMIAKEHCKIQQNQVFIENMKKELKVFKKGDSI